MSGIERGDGWTATPITLSKWTNPKPAWAMRCPSPDGYKTRAARLIGDGLNCVYSHRCGYIVSNRKFERFKQLYAEGWDASSVRAGHFYPPPNLPR